MQHGPLYKCRLLLLEDPAVEAQPRHRVAVHVGRNKPVAHDIVGLGAHFSAVHCFDDLVGRTTMVPNCGGNLPNGAVCMRCTPPTMLLLILLRHPHMCAWIDETRQMNVLRYCFSLCYV